MNSDAIEINLTGLWCNNWPKLKVSLNGKTYFDDYVVGDVNLKLTAPLLEKNTLILEHYDKQFGENGIWDTKLDNGTIVQDRAVRLVSLSLGEVDITKYMQQKRPLIKNNKESVPGLYYGFNGCVTLEFESPIYSWIIDNVVKPELQSGPNFNHPSVINSESNIFEYDHDLNEIKEIEDILDQYYAYMSSKSAKV